MPQVPGDFASISLAVVAGSLLNTAEVLAIPYASSVS